MEVLSTSSDGKETAIMSLSSTRGFPLEMWWSSYRFWMGRGEPSTANTPRAANPSLPRQVNKCLSRLHPWKQHCYRDKHPLGNENKFYQWKCTSADNCSCSWDFCCADLVGHSAATDMDLQSFAFFSCSRGEFFQHWWWGVSPLTQ